MMEPRKISEFEDLLTPNQNLDRERSESTLNNIEERLYLKSQQKSLERPAEYSTESALKDWIIGLSSLETLSHMKNNRINHNDANSFFSEAASHTGMILISLIRSEESENAQPVISRAETVSQLMSAYINFLTESGKTLPDPKVLKD